MLVQCVNNNISSAVANPVLYEELTNSYKTEGGYLPVSIDSYYTVYAVSLIRGILRLFIAADIYSYYPTSHPAVFFHIIDASISRYWEIDYSAHRELFMSFAEWTHDETYYERLVDGDHTAKSLFEKYKRLMDLEFPNPSVRDSAAVLEDRWVMCPLCKEAWEELSPDGLVVCPKCSSRLLNPAFNKKALAKTKSD